MNGFDVVLGIILTAAAVIEAARGFGRAAFDLVGVYAALLLTQGLSEPLASVIRLHSGAAINHMIVFILTFVVLTALLLVIMRFVSGALLFTLGVFDKLAGLVAGLALGILLTHGIVTGVALADPTGQGQVPAYTDGVLSNQILTFSSFHGFVDTLEASTGGHHDDDTP